MFSSPYKNLYKTRKRGTAMPRSKSEVVGKPLFRDMVIAAHAIRVRTITPFSLNSLEFPTFPTSR